MDLSTRLVASVTSRSFNYTRRRRRRRRRSTDRRGIGNKSPVSSSLDVAVIAVVLLRPGLVVGLAARARISSLASAGWRFPFPRSSLRTARMWPASVEFLIDGALPVYDASSRPTSKPLSLSPGLRRRACVIGEQATFHKTLNTDNYVD
jgi:hypothetical protein